MNEWCSEWCLDKASQKIAKFYAGKKINNILELHDTLSDLNEQITEIDIRACLKKMVEFGIIKQ
jgi:hypothetical protein